MKSSTKIVSIITVNYHVKKKLFACLKSIIESKPKISYEIIVVDNDEKKTISVDLKMKFPKAIYVPNENKGFGQGNNIGARYAKGEFLFFLNPDTELYSSSIDSLFDFLKKSKNAGAVAPLLLNKDGKPYQQGTLELIPQRGIFSLSFLNKLFPNNPISRKYFLLDWDRHSTKEVEVVPGTALMMKKSLFEKISGFDEKFFLYFEEFDLCRRIRKLGLKLYIYPKARAFHHWGASTKSRSDINQIFLKSRFYYFRKHFGLLSAVFTETILRINKYAVMLFGILILGGILRIYNLENSMQFIGDQGWFYLSARDLVVNGQIPLVGIASSHPWIHQGALWTYMLAYSLWLMAYNPFAGAYLSGLIDVLAIFLMYKFGSMIFSRRLGLIAAALYATSPLIIANARMPYHTSPIPLFTILALFCVYKWIQGQKYYFPLLSMILAILYNLELATFLLSGIIALIFIFGLIKRQKWARGVLSFKFLVLSCIAFMIPMLPMIIYDFSHGFPQTLKFIAWIGYKILVFFGYSPINQIAPVSWHEMLFFFGKFLKQLIFANHGFVALGIFFASLGYSIMSFPSRSGMTIILVLNVLLVSGFFVAKTPSEAYLPMMFPGLILLTSLFFDGFLKRTKKVGIIFILLIISFNSFFFFSTKIFNTSFTQRLSAAKYIVKESEGEEYNLIGKGDGSQFESFTMNYEYLTWWLGHGPAHDLQELQFVISEDYKGIHVIKSIKSIKSTKGIKSS